MKRLMLGLAPIYQRRAHIFSLRRSLNKYLLFFAFLLPPWLASAKNPGNNPSTATEFKLSATEIASLEEKALSGDGGAANKLYENYYLSELNYLTGEYWLRICAENGVPNCQYNIGFIMSDSKDKKEKARGLFWLRRAEASGVKEASRLIAERYKR